MWPSWLRARILYRMIQDFPSPLSSFFTQQSVNATMNSSFDYAHSCHLTSVHYRSMFAFLHKVTSFPIYFKDLTEHVDEITKKISNEIIICIRMFKMTNDSSSCPPLLHDFCVHGKRGAEDDTLREKCCNIGD